MRSQKMHQKLRRKLLEEKERKAEVLLTQQQCRELYPQSVRICTADAL